MNVYATCSHLEVAIELAAKLSKTYKETFNVKESDKGWGFQVISTALVCKLY
jgi:hypothetical protein